MKKLLIAIVFISCVNNLKAQDTLNAKSKVTRDVEVEAEFPNGDDAFIKFLEKNLIYPSKEVEMEVTGKSEIEFVVCPSGDVCDFKVLKSAGNRFDEEAIRVLKKTKWKPAQLNGKQVYSYHKVPISYYLEGEDDESEYVTFHDLFLEENKYYDEYPEYLDGLESMQLFIEMNVKSFSENGTKTSWVKFEIDENGVGSNFGNYKGEKEFESEVLRLVQLLKWKPAVLNGKPVKSKVKLVIVFGSRKNNEEIKSKIQEVK